MEILHIETWKFIVALMLIIPSSIWFGFLIGVGYAEGAFSSVRPPKFPLPKIIIQK